MNEELIIDPEFEKVIPPLTDDEFRQLEENILADGEVLMALIVWNGIIVDGHNRYKIALKHPEISFRTYEMLFDNRFEVISWICKNQLGRRNLTPENKRYLIAQRYKAERDSEEFHGNQYTESEKSGGDTFYHHQNKALKTRQKIAADAGVSEAYVQKANEYANGVDAAEEVMPGIKQALLSSTIKAPAKDVAAIAKASPEERPELVENLRKPKDKSPSKPKSLHAPTEDEKQLEQISEISEDMVRPHPCITEKDILGSMEGAIQMMIDTCNNYFMRYPKLRTEPEYKIKVKEIMQELQKYIDEIEGEESI